MGHVLGTIASEVKEQGNRELCELYELVELYKSSKGDGRLVQLMHDARWTKKYEDLDDAIKKSVTPFLYNGGKGEYIPIKKLIERRNLYRGKGSLKPGKINKNKYYEVKQDDFMAMQENGEYSFNKFKQEECRFQCWDLDKRGTAGETILHLCGLRGTPIHTDLVKRLLTHFPNLVHDIYIGDEYYGETILHQAIVNEDPTMVKFLLDLGADCHAHACGKFLLPDDQRDARSDCWDYECVDVCKETNYKGWCYLGNYPLSFAACLLQEECVRILLKKRAQPNRQDINGNTVMHMLVIHDNKGPEESLNYRRMFDLLHSEGARLDVKNNQGLTPMTLAAKLGRKDMFDHICKSLREVYWLYGNVTGAGFPLTDIDTISSTGKINTNSALKFIVCGKTENHLNMMSGVIEELLRKKWKNFACMRFYRRFFFFFCYFILFSAAFLIRPGTDLCASLNNTSTLDGCGQPSPNRTIDSCYLSKPYRNNDKARFVLEAVSVICAAIYLFLAGRETYHQGFRIFFSTLISAPAKGLFLISVLLVIIMVPLRAACAYNAENILGVMAILLTISYFLFFLRGFRITGPFVIMIYNMIHGDLLRFVSIYLIFLMGFSQAVYIPFRNMHDVAFSHWLESILAMFSMSVGDFEDLYEHFDNLPKNFNGLIKTMFVLYMIMVTLLLVNMLIAMMARTYHMVRYTEKEWYRQWANIILIIEQTLTTDVLKAKMIDYSDSDKNDTEKRLVKIRWHHTERERKELKEKRRSNKIVQKNLSKRQEQAK